MKCFKGDIGKYHRFREYFKNHINPGFADAEEAFVLRSYLDHEIKEDVLALGDNVEAIWSRLDCKYGDQGKLIDSIMAEVKHTKRCKDNNPKGVIEMITIIEMACRDLSILSMEREMSNSTIVSLIEEKLPKDLEDDWLEIVTGEDRTSIAKNKFPHLLKLLTKHKEKLEYKFSELRYLETKSADSNVKEIKSIKGGEINVADGRSTKKQLAGYTLIVFIQYGGVKHLKRRQLKRS